MFQDQLELRETLARRDHHPVVKLLMGENIDPIKLTVREALLLAHSEDCAWGGRAHRRVRWMRALRKPLPWEACYRTMGSPSIPISPDWGRHDEWRDLSAGEFEELMQEMESAREAA
jgi:hypothetical protein